MDPARPGADAGLSRTYHPLSSALADRYRIERALGEGGMATVFLAHDIKHDRRVALKVLKPELAAVLGAERFVVEIRTTAALQHPHILPLFDSGTADGFLYYVMPFIDGETLRAKLDRETQLGIDEAVKIATAVADALDYAHRHGVIHRDIKPENILLHDGRPMVADFGIALAVSAAAGGRMTETGLSLGTPHYMSPEQATAEKEITGRSDIYSLASVLFEMLAGQPPHLGGSAQQIIMKIIAEPAQTVTRHRKSVPPNVAAALSKGLEKLPADRFESAAAFGAALHNPTFASGAVATPGPTPILQTRTRVVAAAGGAVVGATIAAVALLLWRTGAVSSAQSAERIQVTYSGRATSPAISPDGRFVAYVETHCPDGGSTAGCASLYVNEVGTTRPVEVIGGANRLTTPRWTHDGLSLVIGGAFGAGRPGLFSVARLGGTPRRFADEPTAYDIHPSADSVALIVGNESGVRLRVVSRESGLGPPEVEFPFLPVDISWSRDARMFAASSYDDIGIVGRDGKVLSHKFRTGQRAYVRWSADGKNLLAFRWTPGEEDDLIAFPISTNGAIGEPRLLMSRVATLLRGRFDVARTGRIAIGSGAVFSDIWSFDFSGATVRRRRETQGTNWYGPPVITADGRTIYYLRADAVGNSLYRITDGRETAVTAERQMVNSSLRLSRDERTITFESLVDSVNVLMVHDIAAGSSRQVPRGPDDMGWALPGNAGIVWAGPYSREVWTTDSAGESRRLVAKSIGGPQTEVHVDDELFGGMYGGIWSLAPDGRSLAIMRNSRAEIILFRVPLRGGEPTVLRRFARSQGFYGIAAWLPDGTILVSVANPGTGTISIVRVDAVSGASGSFAELPAACEAKGVSVAMAARRAACIVRDQRADVILIDGIRP